MLNVFFENMKANIRFCEYFIGFISSNDVESRILLIDLVISNMDLILDSQNYLNHFHYVKGKTTILQIKNISISQIITKFLPFSSLLQFL